MPVAQIARTSTTPHIAIVREGRMRVPLQPSLVVSSLGHDAFLKAHRLVARWLRRHLGASGRMRGRA